MKIYTYLTVFPMEALIASNLSPEEFGLYMSSGPRKGAAEQIMFLEIKEEFPGDFDWAYARERCQPHPDGEPKHSVYLGVYRILEKTPLSAVGSLFLTTRDGRTMEILPQPYEDTEKKINYALYQELCPIQPLVVSTLSARQFGEFIISDENKIVVPAILYADLKVLDFDDPQHTGNVGGIYSRNLAHLKVCVEDVQKNKDKPTKTLDRSYTGSFSYQIINKGIYLASGDDIIFYPMPGEQELREKHYDWARSALIL